MTHMQRELESLRASEKAIRNKLRDMEVDNDDLEKSERFVNFELMGVATACAAPCDELGMRGD